VGDIPADGKRQARPVLSPFIVMAGLVAAIHILLCGKQDVDARHKVGHDE